MTESKKKATKKKEEKRLAVYQKGYFKRISSSQSVAADISEGFKRISSSQNDVAWLTQISHIKDCYVKNLYSSGNSNSDSFTQTTPVYVLPALKTQP